MQIEVLNHTTVPRLAVIAEGATVRAAATPLLNPKAGLVLVCGASGAVAGVFSKSDLVRHLTTGGNTRPAG
jgi:CBS domain-containing protein